MNITFAKPSYPPAGAYVVLAWEEMSANRGIEVLNRKTRGTLKRAMTSENFTGKSGTTLTLLAPTGLRAARIILIGAGKIKDFDARRAQFVGGRILSKLNSLGIKQAVVNLDSVSQMALLSTADCGAHIAFGASLASYRFGEYKVKKALANPVVLRKLTVMGGQPAKMRSRYRPLSAVANGVFLTRDLVSEPANVLSPIELAARAQTLSDDGVKVEILGPSKMKQLGMGALLGVAQGSVHEPRLVVMRWEGAEKNDEQRPLAFVGKGVTFDTGGISIKPSAGMGDMKWDMGGAGVVIGLMRALARRKAKVNVVGVVGLVENMPSGNAQRPGDIVTSMSGQTIEVLNTDAEGRLVLADAIWYTQKRFKPRITVDLATLTGAIIVSLGHERAGLFSNNEALTNELVEAGNWVDEKVWPMPMDDEYDKDMDSDIADVQNIGSGRGAGSVTAAKFIERFVDTTPWAHLDIAGVTWSKKSKGLVPKGGTGFGVRLLNRLVANCYETK
ncbi:MAG: leucyl aminopeptidase [Pseudomonadota bacterium]|nr:leucyl aminopeptidase [Pseudomonadota bacterium]